MHTKPEVLALLALGEAAGQSFDRAHVRHCPVCSEEVSELARIADVGRTSTRSESLTSPGPQVWDRIRSELGFDLPGDTMTRTQTPETVRLPSATVRDLAVRRAEELADEAPPRRGGGRRFVALLAAAALALVVGIGVGVTYERQMITPEDRIVATGTLQALPQFPGATGTVMVTADGRGNRKLLLTMASPTPISGEAEVWLMSGSDDTDPTAMGTMTDGQAEIVIPPGMSLFEKSVVDISEEPVGDTDPTHSGTSILRGALA